MDLIIIYVRFPNEFACVFHVLTVFKIFELYREVIITKEFQVMYRVVVIMAVLIMSRVLVHN
jgi:hypothetical protein